MIFASVSPPFPAGSIRFLQVAHVLMACVISYITNVEQVDTNDQRAISGSENMNVW